MSNTDAYLVKCTLSNCIQPTWKCFKNLSLFSHIHSLSWKVEGIWMLYSFSRFIHLSTRKAEIQREEERGEQHGDRLIFYPPLHSLNDHHRQCWTRLEPGAWPWTSAPNRCWWHRGPDSREHRAASSEVLYNNALSRGKIPCMTTE